MIIHHGYADSGTETWSSGNWAFRPFYLEKLFRVTTRNMNIQIVCILAIVCHRRRKIYKTDNIIAAERKYI